MIRTHWMYPAENMFGSDFLVIKYGSRAGVRNLFGVVSTSQTSKSPFSYELICIFKLNFYRITGLFMILVAYMQRVCL